MKDVGTKYENTWCPGCYNFMILESIKRTLGKLISTKGYKHKGEKRNTSGWNTVVVAGKIIEKIGPILAINNLEASMNF